MTYKQEQNEVVAGSLTGLHVIRKTQDQKSDHDPGGSDWIELGFTDDWLDPEIALIEFHDAMGLPVNNQPTRFTSTELAPRTSVIWEELDELATALTTKDVSAQDTLKEFADVLYTVYSLAVATGYWPYLEEAFYRVHESNMTKVDPETWQVQYKNGKVLKGPHYKPPNFDDMNVKYPDED